MEKPCIVKTSAVKFYEIYIIFINKTRKTESKQTKTKTVSFMSFWFYQAVKEVIEYERFQDYYGRIRISQTLIFSSLLVQSLNSPFFPLHIGAERRVQDNLHAHAQNAAIFSPQIGGKTIFGSIF